MLLKKETSERSEKENPVMPYLEKHGFYLISFEGFTIKDKKVSAVLDKYAIENCNLKECDEQELLGKILTIEVKEKWVEKINISNTLGVPFFIVLYSYPLQRIFVFKVEHSDNLEKEGVFDSLEEFANWLYTYRDMLMTSQYEERGLPEFDKKLRKINKPWPGNLDCILGKNEKGILAVIEFQTTIKYSVRNHCNNMFFLPTPYRKGDEQRWLVMDIIRKQLNKPLIILVWSPKEHDDEIKVKRVDYIVYSWQKTDEKTGLYYSIKEIMKIENVAEFIEEIT